MAPNKRKILEAARKYAQKGASAKAIKEYQKLLKLDPQDAKLRLEIGDAYRRWGKVDEAIDAYSRVAEQYMSEGFDARAVAVFKQLQTIDPDRYDSYEPLAELYQRMGLNSDAIRALQTAADGFHREGKKQEALSLLRKMATLDPTNTSSRIKVADLLRQEGMLEEALGEYDAAIEELERQADHETAASVYERILEFEPDRLPTLLSFARCLLELGQADRAEPFARRGVVGAPNETEPYEVLASVYQAEGRHEDLAATYRGLANVYRQRGDEDKARDLLQRFVPPDSLAASDSDVGFGGPSAEELSDLPDDDPLDLGAGMLDVSTPSVDAPVLGEELLDDGGLDGDLLEFDDAAPEELEVSLGEPLSESEPVLELDSVHDLGASAELEASSSELEPEPESAAPPPEPLDAADIDQLLAEANVYLRYGKGTQAIENLEQILAQDTDHRPALEKLGEAFAEGDSPERAVSYWTRAAKIADREADEPGFGILRDRIAALDAAAASALGAGPAPAEEPEPVAEQYLDIEEDPVARPGEDLSLDSLDDEGVDLPGADDSSDADIDDEFEVEIDDTDLVDEQFEDEGEAEAADDEGEEVELDFDLDLEEEDDAEVVVASTGAAAADLEEPVESLASLESEGESVPSDEAGTSASTSQQVLEELEEADFYFQQGLVEEAEGIYRKLLEVAPNHPHVLVRLGEIAAARGGDPNDTNSLDGVSVDAEVPDDPFESANVDSDDAEAEPVDDVTLEEEVELEDDDVEFETSSDAESDDEEDAEVDVAADAELDLAEAVGPVGDANAVTGKIDPDELVEVDDDFDDDFDDEVEEDPEDESDAERAAAPAIALDADESGDIESVEVPPVELEEGPLPNTPPDPPDLMEGMPAPAVEAPVGEGDSFDLAAELSNVFEEGPGASNTSGSIAGMSDDGFAAVFSEFKKGVSQSLEEGDHETHYDLGIAYKEMGLYDDAMSEFEIVVGSAERKVDGLHMLGLCCLEAGRPEDAATHFRKALGADGIAPEQELALRFELGRAYSDMGDVEAAREAFEAVAAVDPLFCDVQDLLAGLGEVAKSDAASDQPEAGAFESFEDVFEDVEDAVEEPSDGPMESFDDLMSDDEPEGDDLSDDAGEPDATDPDSESAPEPEPSAGLDAEPEPALEADEAPVTTAESEAEASLPTPDSPERRKRRRKKKISFA